MCGDRQKRAAMETFTRFGHSYADTIAGLGHPSRMAPRAWWRECGRTGRLPIHEKGAPTSIARRMSEAVAHCLERGRGPSRARRALGRSKPSATPAGWVDALACV